MADILWQLLVFLQLFEEDAVEKETRVSIMSCMDVWTQV